MVERNIDRDNTDPEEWELGLIFVNQERVLQMLRDGQIDADQFNVLWRASGDLQTQRQELEAHKNSDAPDPNDLLVGRIYSLQAKLRKGTYSNIPDEK